MSDDQTRSVQKNKLPSLEICILVLCGIAPWTTSYDLRVDAPCVVIFVRETSRILPTEKKKVEGNRNETRVHPSVDPLLGRPVRILSRLV